MKKHPKTLQLTITYKPLTVTIPAWAERPIREALADGSKEQMDALYELLDEMHAQEGWAAEFESVVIADGRQRASLKKG